VGVISSTPTGNVDAVHNQPSTPVLRNISSQRPVSVCTVLRTVQQVAHRTIRIGLATSPSSNYHVRDLRLCTHFTHEFQGLAITPFPVPSSTFTTTCCGACASQAPVVVLLMLVCVDLRGNIGWREMLPLWPTRLSTLPELRLP
jgi:hypothetical protein